MWDPEPWLQLHLLALRKNGLHRKYKAIAKHCKRPRVISLKIIIGKNLFFFLDDKW